MAAETAIEKCIEALIADIRTLSEQKSTLINEPASYSVSGSVSATNRAIADIDLEISRKIKALKALLGTNAAFAMKYPDESWRRL